MRCRQCKCSLAENPSFESSKCLGCGKQMKTKGKRPDSIVSNNADPRYAGKLDDPQGGDATMLMQQVREVMTVNHQMTNESSWIWLTSQQMGSPLRSELANENHGEAGSSKQGNDQRTEQTSFFLAPIIADVSIIHVGAGDHSRWCRPHPVYGLHSKHGHGAHPSKNSILAIFRASFK